MRKTVLAVAMLAAGSGAAAAHVDPLLDECARPVLEKGEGLASWSAIYNLVFDLDAAADDG